MSPLRLERRLDLLAPLLDLRAHVLRLGHDDAHRPRRAQIVEDGRRWRRGTSGDLSRVWPSGFPHRHDLKLIQRFDRALGPRIEAADRLDRVADELDADGRILAGGIDVENAAAQRELAVLVDRILPLVAAVDEDLGQRLRIDLDARPQIERRREDRLRRGSRGSSACAEATMTRAEPSAAACSARARAEATRKCGASPRYGST